MLYRPLTPCQFLSRFTRATLAATVMAIASLTGFGSGAAHAQVPPLQGEGTVRFACGGIGSDESTAMRKAMKSHPLSLLFARADGDYLADVGITILDAKGATALKMRADGPICLIDLPAGRYTIEAVAEGRTQRHDATIGGKPATADFRF